MTVTALPPVISYQLDEKNAVLTAGIRTYQHVTMSDLGLCLCVLHRRLREISREFSMSNPGITPNKVNEHDAFVNLQHQLNDNWKFTAQVAYFQVQSDLQRYMARRRAADGKDHPRRLYAFDADLEKVTYGQAFVNGET